MDRFNVQITGQVLALYQKLLEPSITDREYPESLSQEGRSEYARDYARVLYSSSFRRLQGKMQILGINSTAFYRNRLTHSLEVSQIARSLAKILAYKCGQEQNMYRDDELYLLDAAALAHDIGHPAFGHKGERVLSDIANVYESRFEGNAQNYKVLRKLDQHGSSVKGLNLTFRTMLAINKYLDCEDKQDCEGKFVKKFMYKDDYEYLNKYRNNHQLKGVRTLDVQIIELADDIAYAVHDLEDGLAQNAFTIDELIFEMSNYENNQKITFTRGDINNAIGLFYGYIEKTKNDIQAENLQQYSHLFRKKLVSCLTDNLIRSISFDDNSCELVLDNKHATMCKLLAKTIFTCITRNPEVAIYEKKGEIVIRTLFNIYVDSNINQGYMLLPPDYRPNSTDSCTEKARCCIDYIAGMMDTYAIAEYERLTGTSFDNINMLKVPDILDINKNRAKGHAL